MLLWLHFRYQQSASGLAYVGTNQLSEKIKRQPNSQIVGFWAPRVTIVLAGIVVGLFAKVILGTADNGEQSRRFENPIKAPKDFTGNPRPAGPGELALPGSKDTDSGQGNGGADGTPLTDVDADPSSEVPPLVIPDLIGTDQSLPEVSYVDVSRAFDRFTHDEHAHFHAHGNTECASGCAASRHPTEKLDEQSFHELLDQYAGDPMDETSSALESLLYFGPQTKEMIQKHGFGPLDRARADFLWSELKITHALISIRVVDEKGIVRSWLKPTRVPFDRRHEFEMEVDKVQPNETSGTVKRVGLYHLWTRL